MPESYISHWNDDACDVNNRLRAIAYEHDDWIRVIEHPQFYTFFGSNKRLLSKDGLHLSYEGTDVLADDIVQAVQQLKVVATTETSLPHVESTRSAVQQLEVVATTASVPAMIHVEQDSPSVLGPRLYSEIVSNGSTTETSLPHVDSTRSGTSRASTRSTTTETSRRHVDSTRSGTSRASTRSTTTETSRRHVDSTRSGTSRESTRSTTSRRHVDSTRSGTSPASTRSSTTETSRRHVDSTRSGTSRESTRSTTSRRHVDYTRSGSSRASTRSGTSQATTRSTTSRCHVYSTSSGTSRASTRSGTSRASTRSTTTESRRHVDSTRSGTSRGSTRSGTSRRSSRKLQNKIILIESDTQYFLSTDTSKLVGGGNDTPMFTKSDRILTHHEAADILQQNLPDSITYEPPYRPEPGSVYVFDDSGNPQRKEDWRADGYTWRNNGRRTYTSEGKTIQRIFFKINNQGKASDKFQKHILRFTDDEYNGRTVLIYFGDKEAYKSLPHGNRKRNSRQFKRTMPSVISKIKSNGLNPNPNELADKISSEASPDSNLKGIKVARNDKQIINIQSNIRKKAKLTHDALYGLHLLVNQLDDYILSIKTTPDLEVVVGNAEIMDELNRLLQLKGNPIDLYYDTTFNLGDFYVSALVCRHPMFKNKPIIPVAFMLHERKFQKCHEQFIDILKSKITKLSEKKICVVTDRETGIMNAFEDRLPNCKLLICWNHILNDIKFWLNKHGGKNADKRVYDAQIRQLMHCTTREEFDTTCNEMKSEWSEPFVVYFEENIYSTIVNYAGRWVLEPLSMYCSYSGVTNNIAESLNAKLKRLVDYKEKSIDDIVLYLNYLQGNYQCDLIRAFCGESEWTLHEDYLFAARDSETVILPKNVCHPDKLIQLIKGQLSEIIEQNKPNIDDNKIENDMDVTEDEKKSSPEKKNVNKGPISQRSLAVKTISENDIILVPQMGAFMVKGNRDNKYSVTLFPKESCSCPATSRCYHIMAAMLSIGMDIPNEKKVFNLTQLRKNCRPKHAKKCGTKKGRVGDTDFEVVAAPDSVLKTANYSVCKTPKSNVIIEHKTSEKTKKKLTFDNSTPKTQKTHTTPSSSGMKRKCDQDEGAYKIPKLEPDLSIINEENEITTFEISSSNLKFDNSTPKTQKTPTTPSSSGMKRKCDQDEGAYKIPKLEPDLSINNEENEITTFEISSRDNSAFTANVFWNNYLRLTNDDINSLQENKKLNSNHMEAVNKLLRQKVDNEINGLQLTEKIPIFCLNEKRWKTKIPMDQVQAPACQIHHNHNDHWVSSIYYNGSIYLIDSLGSDRPTDKIIPNGLEIQLSQIYGKDKSKITVKVPTIMKQNNSIDCGLYAIAFITSYCLRKKLCFDIIFDSKKMRSHLLSCFEKQEMTEFPLTTKTLSNRRKTSVVEIDIENYCICNLPACVDTVMVECDKCATWYHKSCIDAPIDISTNDKDFTCGLC